MGEWGNGGGGRRYAIWIVAYPNLRFGWNGSPARLKSRYRGSKGSERAGRVPEKSKSESATIGLGGVAEQRG